LETGLVFFALVFDFVFFVALVNVFAFPFTAFLDVAFERTEAFVAPFDFVLCLTTTLAFLGLALAFLDIIFLALTSFFDTALDFAVTFFLDLGWGLAFDLGLALAAICHPPDNMIHN